MKAPAPPMTRGNTALAVDASPVEAPEAQRAGEVQADQVVADGLHDPIP